MTEGFASIITQLERQKVAIERALAALREVDGIAPPVTPAAASTESVTRSTAATRRHRRSIGQKKRWAAKKAAEAAHVAIPANAARPKSRLTQEGRERLAEAMRRRWAVKRAGSAVKKTTARKQSAKKAA